GQTGDGVGTHARLVHEPSSRLGQRDAHVVAAAFESAALEGHDDAEGGNVARGIVERVRRGEPRPAIAGELVTDAADGLHDAVETTALTPRTFVSESAQAEADDARSYLSQGLGIEATRGQ